MVSGKYPDWKVCKMHGGDKILAETFWSLANKKCAAEKSAPRDKLSSLGIYIQYIYIYNIYYVNIYTT